MKLRCEKHIILTKLIHIIIKINTMGLILHHYSSLYNCRNPWLGDGLTMLFPYLTVLRYPFVHTMMDTSIRLSDLEHIF